MTEFRVELIRTVDQIPVDRSIWNDLVSRNEVNEIFLTHEWVFSWLDAFWGARELFFLAAYENDELAGIAPLLVYDSDRSGKRIRTLGFAGRNASDYNEFIIVGDKRRTLWAMFDYILDVEGFDLVELVYLPEHSSTVSILRHYFRDRNVTAELSFDIVCPTHLLNEESGRIFDKKTKQPRKSLSRLGATDFFTLNEPGAILTFLPGFFDQHIYRRSVYQGDAKSQFLQEEHRQFFRILTHRLPGVRFSALSLDGNHIAFHFGFAYSDKFLYYKPSFDLAYARYSPGLVLLNGVFQYVRDNHLKELDFTIGPEHYKTRFANKTRSTMKLCIQRVCMAN